MPCLVLRAKSQRRQTKYLVSYKASFQSLTLTTTVEFVEESIQGFDLESLPTYWGLYSMHYLTQQTLFYRKGLSSVWCDSEVQSKLAVLKGLFKTYFLVAQYQLFFGLYSLFQEVFILFGSFYFFLLIFNFSV